jgi:hypothetical protein
MVAKLLRELPTVNIESPEHLKDYVIVFIKENLLKRDLPLESTYQILDIDYRILTQNVSNDWQRIEAAKRVFYGIINNLFINEEVDNNA